MPEPASTGLLLFVAYRAMEQRALAVLGDEGFADLTTAQARVLQRVRHDGSRLTELAEAATVTKQTAGFLVDQLQRARYVERVPDPADGRAKLVRIAARGQRAAEVAERTIGDVEAEWEAHLGPRRWAQLRDALVRLREITDPYHP